MLTDEVLDELEKHSDGFGVKLLVAEVRRLREVNAKEREIGGTLERQAVVAYLRSEAKEELGVSWRALLAAAGSIEREEHME